MAAHSHGTAEKAREGGGAFFLLGREEEKAGRWRRGKCDGSETEEEEEEEEKKVAKSTTTMQIGERKMRNEDFLQHFLPHGNLENSQERSGVCHNDAIEKDTVPLYFSSCHFFATTVIGLNLEREMTHRNYSQPSNCLTNNRPCIIPIPQQYCSVICYMCIGAIFASTISHRTTATSEQVLLRKKMGRQGHSHH